mgnify:CR=1 FL=1
MRSLIQVAENAEVMVNGDIEGSIKSGMVIFLGIKQGDSLTQVKELVDKVIGLRIFPDEKGKMNLSIKDVQGEVLVVSQFTLYADVNSGRRPSFSKAEDYKKAKSLYESFIEHMGKKLETKVESGKFGSYMKVRLTNDGPITFLVES